MPYSVSEHGLIGKQSHRRPLCALCLPGRARGRSRRCPQQCTPEWLLSLLFSRTHDAGCPSSLLGPHPAATGTTRACERSMSGLFRGRTSRAMRLSRTTTASDCEQSKTTHSSWQVSHGYREDKIHLTGRSWHVRTIVVLVADGVEEAAQSAARTTMFGAPPTEHEVSKTRRERPIPLVNSA